MAIDLGCGSGFQSIAIKQLGFTVHAVDFSSTLLRELQSRDSTIAIRCQDMCELVFATELKPKVVVCMGDTLTHLTSRAQVLQLFQDVYVLLASQNGTFVISYRDLSGMRSELDRFIPVKIALRMTSYRYPTIVREIDHLCLSTQAIFKIKAATAHRVPSKTPVIRLTGTGIV